MKRRCTSMAEIICHKVFNGCGGMGSALSGWGGGAEGREVQSDFDRVDPNCEICL